MNQHNCHSLDKPLNTLSKDHITKLKQQFHLHDNIVFDNPYQQARHVVLLNMPQWKRLEIEHMEKTGDIDNRHYTNFIKEVASMGDKIEDLLKL